MLVGSARLEQLLGDAPDVGAAEYLVGPGLGELEPDDAPVQAGDGYPSPRPRRTCSGTPTPRAPGSAPGEQLPPRDEYRPGAPWARDVGRPVPPGGSEFGTGTPGVSSGRPMG